ncbi:hypothetical protein LTR17_000512 [Elasticomyces elasticus]|nr:hypothetical protein LTR17_000512 [Elasticomyces elasticus]
MLLSSLLVIFVCSTRTFATPTTNNLSLADNATSLSDIISRTPASADGKTLGTRRYPHAYGNTDNLYFGPLSPPYLEFPIRRDLVLFNGKRGPGKHEGNDWVVFQSGEPYSFLGVMTHEGATGGKGSFILCTKYD